MAAMQGEELAFILKTVSINRWKFFLAQEHKLSGWGLNYGAVYTTSIDHSYRIIMIRRRAGTKAGVSTGIPDNMQSAVANKPELLCGFQ